MPKTRFNVWLALAFAATMRLSDPIRPAHAGEPPKDLYGKSVVVSWKEDRTQRRQDQQEFRNVTRHGEYVVVISDAGELFTRLSMENPKGEKGKRDVIGNTARRFTKFEDDKMVAAQETRMGGARQITVSFASGYTGCSAEVIVGVEAGRRTMIAESMIHPGTRVEIKSVKTRAVTCELREGNATVK
jgi:hypothetical protein